MLLQRHLICQSMESASCVTTMFNPQKTSTRNAEMFIFEEKADWCPYIPKYNCLGIPTFTQEGNPGADTYRLWQCNQLNALLLAAVVCAVCHEGTVDLVEHPLKIAFPGPCTKRFEDYDDPNDPSPITALGARGFTVDYIPWGPNDVDWGKYDLVLPLRVWLYHDDFDRFMQFLEDVEHSGARLANSRKLIIWNIHKSYLLELKSEGILIPETLIFKTTGSAPDLSTLMSKNNWKVMFVKPAVGSNGFNVRRVSSILEASSFQGDFSRLLEKMDMIVQQAIPEGNNREWCIVYFLGKCVNTVERIPDGKSTVCAEHFKTVRCSPPKSVLQLADRTIQKIPYKSLYARVDILEDEENNTYLLEVDCVNPSLYLNSTSGRAFADAVIEMMADT